MVMYKVYELHEYHFINILGEIVFTEEAENPISMEQLATLSEMLTTNGYGHIYHIEHSTRLEIDTL